MLYKGSYYPSLDIAASLAYTNISLDQIRVVFNPNGLERIDSAPWPSPPIPRGGVQIDFMGAARYLSHVLPFRRGSSTSCRHRTFKEKLV
jgi:hypothetical protein